jgi:hypothetical protein
MNGDGRGSRGQSAARTLKSTGHMTIETLALATVLATAPSTAPASPAPESALTNVVYRAERPFVIRADAGWNSLAGLGLRGSWAATPHLAVDVAAGYVLPGPKVGARVRWNFSTAALTPYAAVGGFFSAGRSDPQTINDDADAFKFHVGPAGYVQGVLGLDYQDSDRVTYSFEIGWAQALNERSLYVISGTPTASEWREVRWIAAGGPVIGGSVGYAF